MKDERLVTGLFRSRAAADRAVDAILAIGYAARDVSVVMGEDAGRESAPPEAVDPTRGAAAGAGIGSAVGGTLGAVLGAIAAIGTTFALPGLGLVVAGPIAAALAGAGAGGATGSVLGALVGSGVPEGRATEIEQGLREGGILVTVHPRAASDVSLLERILEDAGAMFVRERVGASEPEMV